MAEQEIGCKAQIIYRFTKIASCQKHLEYISVKFQNNNDSNQHVEKITNTKVKL